MKLWRIVLILVLPLIVFAQNEKYIQVGSFNMEWFPCKDDGEMMKKYGINLRMPPRGEATDLKALFSLLKDLDVELLAVVEIVDPELLESSAKKYLGEEFKVIYAPSPSSQKVGFLYDSSVLQVIGKPQVYMDVALGPNTWLRPALRAYFKYRENGFDFNAVVVHLKAAPSGLKKRQKQWKVLGKLLREIPQQCRDEDLVMMGDFNNVSRLGIDEFKPLMDSLHYYWATSELADKNISSDFWQPDYSKKYIEGSLIDQIFISAGARQEYVENSVRVGGMCAEGKNAYKGDEIPEYYKKISDHCPVFATFRVDLDND